MKNLSRVTAFVIFAVFLVSGIFLVSGSASALPSEWGVINPNNLVATDAQMESAMAEYWNTEGTGPAYFVWTEDVARTNWNLAWTGGYGNTSALFSGLISLQNATTNEFTEVAFNNNDNVLDDDDVISISNDSGAIFTAYASNNFDGIKFTIDSYELPSFVGFDLNANLQSADPETIFLGFDMETVASLGGDQDFSMAAPVPEPATLFLLGAGLLGLAGIRKKKQKNNLK